MRPHHPECQATGYDHQGDCLISASGETAPRPPADDDGRLRTLVGFRMPTEQYDVWQDKAVESLVGQTCDFSLLGEPIGKAKITAARKYEDEILGPSIWVEVELVD